MVYQYNTFCQLVLTSFEKIFLLLLDKGIPHVDMELTRKFKQNKNQIMVELKPLEASDKEQFIKDNQKAFNYGALDPVSAAGG